MWGDATGILHHLAFYFSMFFSVFFPFGELLGSSEGALQSFSIRYLNINICLLVNRFHMSLYNLCLAVTRRPTSHFGKSPVERYSFHYMYVPSYVRSRQAIGITSSNGLFRMRIRHKVTVRQRRLIAKDYATVFLRGLRQWVRGEGLGFCLNFLPNALSPPCSVFHGT